MFGCLSSPRCLGSARDTDEGEVKGDVWTAIARGAVGTPRGTKGDLWARLAEEEQRSAEEGQRREQEVKRRAQEAEDLRRAEDEARHHSEELWRQAKELERAYREEKGRYEQLRREREAVEHAESARRAEAKRLAKERERWLRKAAVLAFLREHGFSDDVGGSKRVMLRTTYPLHVAAEEGNSRMVEMLLREGADPTQCDSSSRTAAQVALEKNKGGSHTNVLQILRKVSAPRFGGA